MSNATVPCMSHFTTAKGEHWCSIEVGIEHANRAYAQGAHAAHEGPCVEISTTLGIATENKVWAAMKSNAHLIRPAAPRLEIHTAGELHPAPEIGRVTFTFNLSDLLDDPAHKPDADLIKLDGADHRMQDFVFFTEGALDLYEDMVRDISRQLERGKNVTVLILCRGGKHRSVAFGENLAAHFEVTATHHHRHLPRVVSA